MEEISIYDDYQDLIRALLLGVEQINNSPSRNAIYGIQHLSSVEATLKNPDPSGLFRIYHQNFEPSQDHRDVPFIWDFKVEYNGEEVKYRLLIEKLEKLWNEYLMLNEGGV